MSGVGFRNQQHQERLAQSGRAQEKAEAMNMFAAPSAPSGGITWADHKGALLLVEPTSVETGIQTVHGPSDAVKADVHVIEGAGAGESFTDTLIFPKILQSQTRSMVGQKVLGRLSQGQAKPGQSAPWLLEAATPADVAKAEQWVAAKSTPSVQSAVAPF